MRNRLVFLFVLASIIVMDMSAQKFIFDSMSPTTIVVYYDPALSSPTYPDQITVTARRPTPGNKDYYYYLIDGLTTPASRTLQKEGDPSKSITVAFYTTNTYTNTITYSTATSRPKGSTLWGLFDTGVTTNTLTIFPRINAGQSVPEGTYSATFKVILYDASGTSPNTKDTSYGEKTFSMTAYVMGAVDMRIGAYPGDYNSAPSSSSYSISLGEVSKGATAQFGVYIRATRAYNLTLTSTGQLSPVSGSTDRINFSLTINGSAVAMGTNVLIESNTSVTPVFYKAFNAQISVPAGQDVEAGSYTGTIQFSISAN